MTPVQHTVILIEKDPELTLDEICQALQVTPEFVSELIAYGIIEPKEQSADVWRFDMGHLGKIRRALSLLNELEVNMQGAALAMELMDQIEILQAQVVLFERYLAGVPIRHK